jgi:16S rRNA (cytosine1402-N4)-methyltransferase
MSDYHIPVMLKEVLEFLQIKKDHWYVDCNLGGGGHTKGILEMGGKVIGIDLDPDLMLMDNMHPIEPLLSQID